MHRTHSCLEYHKALMHYSQYGKGSKVLICFHGYGQTIENFHALEDVFREEYTIYSIDLFYHGKSFWHEREKPLTKEFWNGLMKKFLEEKNIGHFSLLGFSMGGKFVLATLESYHQQIERLILIAPDGIKTSFWYSLATYPGWMRKLFRRIIIKPGIYFTLVKYLGALKLMDKGVLRFANTQMITRRQRRRVYYSWIVFSDLKFDMDKIASILKINNIKLEMYLGEYDKVITQKNMKRLLDKLDDYQINILSSGHSSLIDAVAEYYKKLTIDS
ncbi:MAG: alpha/beta hydrolase [Cytophagaceae bacterium]|nr:alpha/beta hydrolase [Cytophagaceae bacterium]